MTDEARFRVLRLLVAHLSEAHEILRKWAAEPEIGPEEKRRVTIALGNVARAEETLKS